MKSRLRLIAVCALLLVLCFSIKCVTSGGHEEAFDRDRVLKVQAKDLKFTSVSPHLDVPLTKENNVLWCGTFQLAWNEVCTLIGENVQLSPPSPITDALNKKAFNRADLDEPSFVAMAGFVKDGIHQAIQEALQKKFGGLATPQITPDPALTPRPQDIVAYAYLFKNLEFPTPFMAPERPLKWDGNEVATFGLEIKKPGKPELYSQVCILDYETPDNFVIELKTKADKDRIILAKVDPQGTLGETAQAVMRRTEAGSGEKASPLDVLIIPKLNFDITRQYTELERKALITSAPNVAKDLQLLSALQNTRFQMNERGVVLRSESEMSFGCSKTAPYHIMIFDKPFLTLLVRRDAKTPYFALWIANSELLIKR